VSLLYSPEYYGVEIVANFDAYEANYSFDILVVVRDLETGKLYAAADSGCSCPTPFEDHTYPTDFEEVRSWDEVKAVLDREFPNDPGSYRRRLPHDSLRRAVQKALSRDFEVA
jgi:hypothetical protein